MCRRSSARFRLRAGTHRLEPVDELLANGGDMPARTRVIPPRIPGGFPRLHVRILSAAANAQVSYLVSVLVHYSTSMNPTPMPRLHCGADDGEAAPCSLTRSSRQ